MGVDLPIYTGEIPFLGGILPLLWEITFIMGRFPYI